MFVTKMKLTDTGAAKN